MGGHTDERHPHQNKDLHKSENKQTGEYEQDFSGYVMCVGTAAAATAGRLTKGDRIKLGDCDVTTKYDKDKKITYTNYAVFSLEEVESKQGSSDSPKSEVPVDDGEPDLPF